MHKKDRNFKVYRLRLPLVDIEVPHGIHACLKKKKYLMHFYEFAYVYEIK